MAVSSHLKDLGILFLKVGKRSYINDFYFVTDNHLQSQIPSVLLPFYLPSIFLWLFMAGDFA